MYQFVWGVATAHLNLLVNTVPRASNSIKPSASFKLADMEMRRRATELITYQATAKADENAMSDMDAALAKLSATEALVFIADLSVTKDILLSKN